MNIFAIAGFPAGIAPYFLANRQLPFGIADRAEWEHARSSMPSLPHA